MQDKEKAKLHYTEASLLRRPSVDNPAALKKVRAFTPQATTVLVRSASAPVSPTLEAASDMQKLLDNYTRVLDVLLEPTKRTLTEK